MGTFRFHLIGAEPVDLDVAACSIGDLAGLVSRERFVEGRVTQPDEGGSDLLAAIADCTGKDHEPTREHSHKLVLAGKADHAERTEWAERRRAVHSGPRLARLRDMSERLRSYLANAPKSMTLGFALDSDGACLASATFSPPPGSESLS